MPGTPSGDELKAVVNASDPREPRPRRRRISSIVTTSSSSSSVAENGGELIPDGGRHAGRPAQRLARGGRRVLGSGPRSISGRLGEMLHEFLRMKTGRA